jgi:starvation-inducible DNA-binding protein
MTGAHFRDYHLLLDEQAEQIFATIDDVAERTRKIGGASLRSIGDIARHQRLADNDQTDLSPRQMLSEIRGDNLLLAKSLRETHRACAHFGDVATTSMLEVWIDQTERRTWFLSATICED